MDTRADMIDTAAAEVAIKDQESTGPHLHDGIVHAGRARPCMQHSPSAQRSKAHQQQHGQRSSCTTQLLYSLVTIPGCDCL